MSIKQISYPEFYAFITEVHRQIRGGKLGIRNLPDKRNAWPTEKAREWEKNRKL